MAAALTCASAAKYIGGLLLLGHRFVVFGLVLLGTALLVVCARDRVGVVYLPRVPANETSGSSLSRSEAASASPRPSESEAVPVNSPPMPALPGADTPFWGPHDEPLWSKTRGFVQPAGSHPLTPEALHRSFTAPSDAMWRSWARVAAALEANATVTICVIGGSSACPIIGLRTTISRLHPAACLHFQ